MKVKYLKNLLLIFLAALAIIQFANQRVTMDRINRVQEEQINSLEQVQNENNRLLEEVQKLNSSEYIAKQARERLQMIKPDETPVINSPGSTTSPIQTKPSTTTDTKP